MNSGAVSPFATSYPFFNKQDRAKNILAESLTSVKVSDRCWELNSVTSRFWDKIRIACLQFHTVKLFSESRCCLRFFLNVLTVGDSVCIQQLMLPTQCVIRWSVFYMWGYRSLSPERIQGNGSENWVHLVQHLLAKCKQTMLGSSPTIAAQQHLKKKKNPVAQQLRNPALMVTSAAEQS